MYQQTAWWITVLGVLMVAGAFVFVVLRSGERREHAPIQATAYRWRSRLFWLLVAAGVPIMGLTLTDLPYAAAARAGGEAVQVRATAYQWYWELSRSEVPAGRPVVFQVTGADVNHGFGLYDASMRLLAQTQAMPGYTNELVHVFERPGTYRILCLEYCGVAHHAMEAEITVLAAQEGA
jgi:cytochrome c oxidase subunit 2